MEPKIYIGRDADRDFLNTKSKEELIELLFLHMRNLWAVDGLYFLGIEEKFGTEQATEIDKNVWQTMGKIEARKLKSFMNLGNDIESLITALRTTSWALDLEDKEFELSENRAIIRNIKCRTQLTRLNKNLTEFPCKPVRYGYLQAFAKEFNPKIKTICRVCPPDKHEQNLWCEWEFTLEY